MNNDESDERLLAVAVAAVLLEELSGWAIGPSIGRASGSKWSIDHRRMAIGMTSLLGSKSRRSSRR